MKGDWGGEGGVGRRGWGGGGERETDRGHVKPGIICN